ncbi:MAG: tetratricopeptide repeat protein, partial [Phycisphaerae bacterium]
MAPRDPRGHALLSRLAWQEQAYDSAVLHGCRVLLCDAASDDRAPSERPETVLARLYLGLSLEEEGYWAAAAEQLNAFADAVNTPTDRLRAYPELAAAMVLFADEVQSRLGRIYDGLGDHARAAQAFEAAAELNPRDVALKRRWVLAVARSGDAERALSIARRVAHEIDPDAGIDLLEQVCRRIGAPDRLDQELMQLGEHATRADLVLRVAERRLADGRRDKAVALLEQACRTGQADASLCYRLAELYAESRQWRPFMQVMAKAVRGSPATFDRASALIDEAAALKSAPDELRGALEAMPPASATDPATAAVCAKLLIAAGQPERADALLDEVYARVSEREAADDPAIGPLVVMRAMRLSARRRWADVIHMARAAQSNGVRNAAVAMVMAQAMEAEDDWDGAESAYRDAATLARDDPNPLLQLARVYQHRGRFKQAERTYREILSSVDPRQPDAHEQLVRLDLLSPQHGDGVERARRQVAEMKRLGVQGPAMRRCSALLEAASDPKRGGSPIESYQDVLRDLLRRDPNDELSALDLARSYAPSGDYERALAETDRLLARTPDHVEAREFKVRMLRRLLRQDEAHALLADMSEERPRYSAWREMMVELALDRVDDETAMRELRILIERDDLESRRPRYQSLQLRLLIASGRDEEAVAAARTLYEQDPKGADRRRTYVRTLEWTGRHDRAVNMVKRLHQADPAQMRLRGDYVDRLAAAGRYLEASQLLLSWMEDEPENRKLALTLVADVLLPGGQYDEAVALLRTWYRDKQKAAVVFDALVQALISSGRADEAVELSRNHASSDSPQQADVRMLQVYVSAGRMQEARRLMERMIEPLRERRRAGRPYNAGLFADLIRQLSSIRERLGDRAIAEALLEELLDMQPNAARVNNDLGYLWADTGRNLEQAESMIRKATAMEPRQSAYLDSLAWVIYKR